MNSTRRNQPRSFVRCIASAALTFMVLGGIGTQVLVWGSDDVATWITGNETGERDFDNKPEFRDYDFDADCVSMREWNRSVSDLASDDLNRIPPNSAVVHLDGTTHVVSTDVAWEKAETMPESSYWIVGACK